MEYVDFLLSHYNHHEVMMIAIVHMQLAKFTGDAEDIMFATSMMRELFKKEEDNE